MSTVIRLDRKPAPAGLTDEGLFFSLVKAAFAQRRKTLVNALSPLLCPCLTKDQIQAVISDCGFPPLVRGETLSISDYVELTNGINKVQKESSR